MKNLITFSDTHRRVLRCKKCVLNYDCYMDMFLWNQEYSRTIKSIVLVSLGLLLFSRLFVFFLQLSVLYFTFREDILLSCCQSHQEAEQKMIDFTTDKQFFFFYEFHWARAFQTLVYHSRGSFDSTYTCLYLNINVLLLVSSHSKPLSIKIGIATTTTKNTT